MTGYAGKLIESQKNLETATLAGGCFWCSQAIFKRLKGVQSVVSGYAGGKVANPTYQEVSSGSTGHAEAIQITFDPKVIPYERLLGVFWQLHDPTTPNRQGNDVGPQYRSAIFAHDRQQKEIAEKSKKDIEESGVYQDKIITEIVPFTNFYKAEDYHQNFYDQNRTFGYCRLIIDPKIQKLNRKFKDYVKVRP